MSNRTISLRSDLVDRLETLAEQQGRSLDEVFSELLGSYASTPTSGGNWALALAEAMEAADIEWIDDPDASINSRANFKRYLSQKGSKLPLQPIFNSWML
jgi:hypothetical protein